MDFNRLDSLWKRLGFSFPLLNNPSVALGTAEASIGELAVAYAAFSNGGYRVTPRKLISIKSADGKVIWQNKFNAAKVRVFSARTVYVNECHSAEGRQRRNRQSHKALFMALLFPWPVKQVLHRTMVMPGL